MKSIQWICAVVLIFFALAPVASATTRYVNGVAGSDTNSCTLSLPCKTIGHAISLAASGDTIRVAAATYYEHLSITVSLAILGAGASTTIIDGTVFVGFGGPPTVAISNTSAHVTLSQLTIRNGRTSSGGAGIANSGTLTLTNSTVSGNSALSPCIVIGLVCFRRGTASGGGIYNSGALTIRNSIISGNAATSSCTSVISLCSAFGGGINNHGTLIIQNSTLAGNSAAASCTTSTSCGTGFGGAIYSTGGTVTLNNSTVEGNIAYHCSGACSGTSAAVFNSSGNLALNNSTVSGNNSTVGGHAAGGVFNGGTATLQNSIVANNSATNCGGIIASHGYNLSSDGTCDFTNTGDLSNKDPQLGPLQNNGGPTPTMALPSGSPAVDAGNPTGCRDSSGNLLTTDQRGAQRPDTEDGGRGCDIGAFERQSD